MADFNEILVAARTNRAIEEADTDRAITGSRLVAGVTNKSVAVQPSQTIRISSGGDNSFQTAGNQDPRGQVPPNTLNKLPRVYGSAVVGGVVIDAVKHDVSTHGSHTVSTIVYAMVLSDMDQSGFDYYEDNTDTRRPPFTCATVYRDNAEVSMDSGAGVANKVDALVAIADGAITDVSNANIRVNVYAGNSTSSAQIFPGTQAQNAYDIMPGWDANVTMEDTVFAIVQVTALDQNATPGPEVKINNFGDWRFDISSLGYQLWDSANVMNNVVKPLSNPAYALQDYLTNDKYGVGLVNSDLDIDSFEAWAEHCDENLSYSYYFNGFQTIGARDTYVVGGVLDTQAPIVNNIEAICNAGQGTLSYDDKQGKFRVLINRAMSTAEQSAAFHFTSDNILSQIAVSTTDLYSLYNFAEVTFNNSLQQDIADTIIMETDAADKLQNEPTAGTSLELAMVNDRPRAAYIGNATLKQSRVGTVAKLSADHSSMVVDVGDFVKVTDSGKGWTEKFFRVMRIDEESDFGSIACAFTLAEYISTPYDKIIYWLSTDDAFGLGVGEERFYDGTLGSLTFDSPFVNYDYSPEYSFYNGLYVYGYPGQDGYTVNTDTGATATAPIASSPLNVQPSAPDLNNESWLIARAGTDVSSGDPAYDTFILTVLDQTGVKYNGVDTKFETYAEQFPDDYVGIPMNKLKKTSTIKLQWQYVNSSNPDGSLRHPPEYSNVYQSASFTYTDASCLGNDMIDTYGENSQISAYWVDAQLTNNRTGIYEMGSHTHDVTNHKPGKWTFEGEYKMNWSNINISGTETFAAAPKANITFVNTSNVDSVIVEVNAPGVSLDSDEVINNYTNNAGKVRTFSHDFTLDAHDYGLDTDWYASRVTASISVNVNSIWDTTIQDTSYTITNKSPLYRDQ